MSLADAVERFIASVATATDDNDLHRALARLTRAIGASRYLMGTESTAALREPHPKLELITDYPEEWMERYERQGLLRIDPLVRYARTCTAPAGWREIPADGAGQRMLHEAAEVRLRDGIVLPLRPPVGSRPAILCFATDRPWKEVGELLPWLSLAALHLSDALARIRSPHSPLTARQMETLALVADGKSHSMIAQLLGISESTVKFHVGSILENLGAANRANAVRLAMLYDLLPGRWTRDR